MAPDRARELYDELVRRGEIQIDDLIRTRESESFFLDFKRSSNNGAAGLSSEDRKNLAKAISGFGNSEGGVVVWGVECSDGATAGDVAQAKYPLQDAAAFRARLEAVVSGCTVPAHASVVSHAIPSGQPPSGFVVTYVPKSSKAPHQTIPDMRYHMRAGSSFSPVPHGVLAGLFGRRPQPHVFPNYILGQPTIEKQRIIVECGIAVVNEGPGIARDLFVVATVASLPGKQCSGRFELNDKQWSGGLAFGVQASLVSAEGCRIAPQSMVQPLILRIEFQRPFTRPLRIALLVGADGSTPYEVEWSHSPESIEATFASLLAGDAATDPDPVARLLGIPDEKAIADTA